MEEEGICRTNVKVLPTPLQNLRKVEFYRSPGSHVLQYNRISCFIVVDFILYYCIPGDDRYIPGTDSQLNVTVARWQPATLGVKTTSSTPGSAVTTWLATR